VISDAEVRRAAARLAVEPMVVDLDYVLGCFLASLFGHPDADAVKGGVKPWRGAEQKRSGLAG